MPDQELVSVKQFIESIRNEGIGTIEAINEFIDNSFDAGAENIYITLGSNDDELYLIIEDDGEGIPADELSSALAFGGRFERERITTGKFGWGLSASAICQSPRTEVYSKHEESFQFNYLDRDEIKEDKGLPETTEKNPFDLDYDFQLDENADSGTIIILNPLDNPKYKTRNRLSEEVSKNVARVHRKKLAAGKSIYVNDNELDFIDPLMLMDGFDGEEEIGKATNYGRIEPIEVELEDGETAEVEITISKLPIGELVRNKEMKKNLDVNQENQGFYLIRNGREIGGGKSLYLFKKHPTMNYFRGEIVFPPELDEMFGVQTNKSRFSLDEDMRDKIEDKVGDILASLRPEIEKERTKENKEKVKDPGTKTSEKIAESTAEEDLKSPDKADEEEKEELEKEKQEIQQKLEDLENKTEEENKDEEEEADEEETQGSEEDKEELRNEDQEDVDDENIDQKKEMLEEKLERLEEGTSYRIKEEVLGSGHFYGVTNKEDLIDVEVNTSHKFYTEIYQKAKNSDNNDLQTGIELLLFALAHAESQHWQSDEVRDFYEDQRDEWSSIMKKFLRRMEREFGDN